MENIIIIIGYKNDNVEFKAIDQLEVDDTDVDFLARNVFNRKLSVEKVVIYIHDSVNKEWKILKEYSLSDFDFNESK